MKKLVHILTLLMSIVAISCNDQSIDMGTVTYYPSFLWSKADTVPVLKTFEFDFSEDAKAEQSVFAEFAFVNNDGKPVTPEELIVYVDGVELKENTFRVTSADSKKEIKYIFPSTAEGGKHQGYLKLINHNLHRIGNEQLTPGQTADVFQWTIYFDKKCNPLKKTLIWIVGILLVCLLLWKLIGRKIAYPRFKTMKKQVIVEKDGQILTQKNVEFTGAIKVVFASYKINQSVWERFFKGKIVTFVNPEFINSITFTPTRNKKNARVQGKDLIITPNPIPQNGTAIILDNLNHLKLSLI